MGISISEFNEMTPYELTLCAEVYGERAEAEKEEKVTLVWLHEHYHRMKKLTPLKDVIDNLFGRKKKVMTDEEMMKTVELLNKKLGGTVESKDGV
jgi:hypothetical protein